MDFRNEDRAPLAVHSGRRGQHHAALGQPVQRQALPPRQEPTRLQGVRGTLPLQVVGREGWEEVADYALEWAESTRWPARAPELRPSINMIRQRC